MSTAKERLDEILSDQNVSIQGLCDMLGISRNIASALKNGQTKNFTTFFSGKIVEKYPEYSELWLLTGKGPKYVTSISGDTNIDIDMSDGKRENSGSGNYYECADTATILLQHENEHLKAEVERLTADLAKSEAERLKLLDKILNT